MLSSRLSRVGFWIARELSRELVFKLTSLDFVVVDIQTYLEQDLDPVSAGNTSALCLKYCQKQEPFRVPYFKSTMVFLPQLQTMLLREAMNRKKRPQHSCGLGSILSTITHLIEGLRSLISVTFVSKDGEETQIRVPVGMSMLEAAHENDLELEGKNHDFFDMEYYNKLEDPTDEENDMLDLAFGLTETSRLGCQIVARPELDGIRLAIPAATRNFAVDGYNRLLVTCEDEMKGKSNRRAFGRTKEECESLEDIGREIVKKCKGLPLAAKVLGGLMRSKRTEEQWQSILGSEIWELESGPFPPLLLSYYDLPYALKRCFSYCAVFPKDKRIWKDDLIELWMAQGYLQGTECKDMEIVGQEYFDELAMRSFFQDFTNDRKNNIISCKMHDIVHDCAKFLTKSECVSVAVNGAKELYLSEEARHLSLSCPEGDVSVPECIHNAKKQRTLLTHGRLWLLEAASLSKLFDQLTHLRAVNLHGCCFKELPESIGKLMHLKYLNLSGNFLLKELLEVVCDLCYLQTLDLTDCCNLEMLPSGLGKLCNLRHLKMHVLGREARRAKFDEKNGLHSLELSKRKDEDAFVLEALQPPPNLESLSWIDYFGGPPELPSWMMSLTKLKKIELTDGEMWDYLPPLGKLLFLEELTMTYLIATVEFLGVEGEAGQSSVSIIAFPNLKFLQFREMKEWEEWEYRMSSSTMTGDEVKIMPNLQSLQIDDLLKELPCHLPRNPTLNELSIYECPILEQHCKTGGQNAWINVSPTPDIFFAYGSLCTEMAREFIGGADSEEAEAGFATEGSDDYEREETEAGFATEGADEGADERIH
ncbi:Disease resistance protein [Corchorus olitorius]|uniref:Disease resistance protein n=1 Tax=Corchorus olitorius TaxID=93759 RepID=A0A1R3HUS9_9ROSI|nr:Disease resistance protein [Corchorus olitorius]